MEKSSQSMFVKTDCESLADYVVFVKRLTKLAYSRNCKCISEMTDEVEATTTSPICCTYILSAFVLIVWARKAYLV
jgi:hypothetical protein